MDSTRPAQPPAPGTGLQVSERQFRTARKLLTSLKTVELCGQKTALRAVVNYRTLRTLGITPRKTIDTVIATYCIENGCRLLHSDRDFLPFAAHLGLQLA